MGKATFFCNQTTTPQTFTLVPGITTYRFVVIGGGGGGGGGGGSGDGNISLGGGNGGNGAVVKTTYTNVTTNLNMVIGGGGGGGGGYVDSNINDGGGGGLTQIFSSQVNIIAGGGGGGDYFGAAGGAGAGGTSGAGGTGGGDSVGAGGIGGAGGVGGAGGIGGARVGGAGGNYNQYGRGSDGGDVIDSGAGAGGGGAGINGETGTGGSNDNTIPNGGVNGGGGGGHLPGACGGGGAGYGGGGGGYYRGGGGAGGSIALLNPQTVSYAPAPYNNLLYGVGGSGGKSDTNFNGQKGQDGYVEITWDDKPTPPTPTPPTPTPILSDICFPAGTPIKTDQGIVSIEKIQPGTHTLAGQPIQHITQTCTLDKYLIAFAPNALGKNMPRRRTIMTKDHQILFKDQLVPAERFLKLTRAVTKVAYGGETLYNVLLPNYQTMNVNGLQCETLHPDNAIARLYKSNFKTIPPKTRAKQTTTTVPAYKSLTRNL